jgi:hypothetical protein
LTDEHGETLGVERLPSRVTMQTGMAMRDILLGVPRANGRTLWLSENTHALYRAPGEPPYAAFALFRDVTDERQVEAERAAQAHALELQNQELLQQADALERGQALFRSLVDTAGSAIVGLDLDGRVFEWNREAEALFGVSRADALGRDYAEAFVTPRHREQMRGGIAAVLAGSPTAACRSSWASRCASSRGCVATTASSGCTSGWTARSSRSRSRSRRSA